MVPIRTFKQFKKLKPGQLLYLYNLHDHNDVIPIKLLSHFDKHRITGYRRVFKRDVVEIHFYDNRGTGYFDIRSVLKYVKDEQVGFAKVTKRDESTFIAELLTLEQMEEEEW